MVIYSGLKNLTIIKDCLKIIKHLHQKEIDIRNIDLDDNLTFEIFKDGNTTGIFQFSSDGMRSHLKNLKPELVEKKDPPTIINNNNIKANFCGVFSREIPTFETLLDIAKKI